MITVTIPIPGRVADGTAYLDIETRKVDFGEQLEDGWIMKRRWSAFAIGIAAGGVVTLNATYDEPLLLKRAAKLVQYRSITYAATHQFDEMILKGRFTNARRAHSPVQIYPAMAGANQRQWRNIYREVQKSSIGLSREFDIESKDVPLYWCTDKRNIILVHLLRDVLELVFVDGRLNAEARAWIRRVLYSNAYAIELVEGCSYGR
jgi:hypothetical protein